MKINEILILKGNIFGINRNLKELLSFLESIKYKNSKIENITNLFIEFSHIENISYYNFKNKELPKGIYSYPYDFFYEKISNYINTKKIENLNILKIHDIFHNERDKKYIHIFSSKGNIINLNNKGLTNKYKDKIIFTIGNKINNYFHLIKNKEESEKLFYEIYSKLKIENIDENNGLFFWKILKEISNKNIKQNKNEFFKTLCNNLGIDGFIDFGNGIIDSERKYLAVFFNKENLIDIHTFLLQ